MMTQLRLLAIFCLVYRTVSLSVGGVVFTGPCYKRIVAADVNQDNVLNRDEYLIFAKAQSNGVIDNVSSFDALPSFYKLAFNRIACLCSDPAYGGVSGDTQCCAGSNAVIRVTSPPGPSQSDADFRYLYMTCGLTDAAARATLGTPAPTQTMAPSTSAPTPSPSTLSPTRQRQTPTTAPTKIPMVPTTLTPQTPTALPSTPPTKIPMVPTTLTPQTPTALPSTAPTQSPTAVPTIPLPTTPSPTLAPTPFNGIVANASVTYDIGVDTLLPVNQAAYLSDLVAAMDALAEIVREQLYPKRRLRNLKVVGLQEPSKIVRIKSLNCQLEYAAVTRSTDECYTLTHDVTLLVVNETNVTNTVNVFEASLFNAIYDGRLQQQLNAIAPDSPVRVLTGLQNPTQSSSSELSSGALAGIVLGAALVAFVPMVYALLRRNQRRDSENNEKVVPFDENEIASAHEGSMQQASADVSVYTDNAVAVSDTYSSSPQVTEYGLSRKALDAMEAGHDIVAEPEMDADSSNAGSSGWSSSAGVSSVQTGSLDDSMDAALATGATLAALGAASGIYRKANENKATREQLDALIEAGDWAAVGTTAALLAAASDSQSAGSRSSSRATAKAGSVDAARTAELEHLVDAGDWEGVVLAAAKFEASENRELSSAEESNLSVGDSATDTRTAGSPSVSTSISESPSKAQRRAEVRKEVEELVRRVVPEEIDNVDEMMNQFKGREEELVETLRTMQERAIAQKARAATQKAAKVEARRSVQRGVVPGANVVAQRVAALENRPGEASSPARTPDSKTRSALEMAIERGDWEAVGEAAAMMSDGSVSSASATEIDQLANLSMSSSASSPRSTRSGPNADKVAELDKLIEKGDWAAVIERAHKFSKEDKNPRSTEEEEALAQAERWMKIAEEKKKEGANDAAAVDATEWAIQRSLSKMKEAEKRQETTEEDEV